MTKLFRFAVIVFLLGNGTVWGDAAESSLPNVPAPKPPFVARAPAQSSWLIVITPSNSPTAATGARSKYLQAQLWTKSGTALQCANLWSDGTRTEDTIVGPTKFAQSPDGVGVHQFNPRLDPRYHDFTTGDFEMLDWITPEAYVGAFTHAGERCYLFRTKGAKDPASEPHDQTLAQINTPSSPTSVYISIRTGLPLEIDNAEGKYLFQFGSPGELKFPEDQAPPAAPSPPPPPPSSPPKAKANKTPPAEQPSATKAVKKPDAGSTNAPKSE